MRYYVNFKIKGTCRWRQQLYFWKIVAVNDSLENWSESNAIRSEYNITKKIDRRVNISREAAASFYVNGSLWNDNNLARNTV